MKNPVKSTGQDTVSVTKQKSKGYIDFEDTLTPNGKYLRFYMNENGEAVVEWSKNKRSTNYGKPFGSYNPPWYYCEWENFIGLRSGCGTDCKVLTILPLNEKREIQSYSDIAIDIENNLIFYAENPAKNLYYVKNIESGLKVKIPVSIQKPEMWGVDSVKFISKNKLYLKWRDENYGIKNVTVHEKIFSMEFLQGKLGNVLNVKENKNEGNSILKKQILEGFEDKEFSIVFNEGNLEVSALEIGYQHGHTIYALAMNLYRDEKIIYTDTISFYPDASEYALHYLEDGTRVLKITGVWANMGASSYQEDFFLIDSTIVSLKAISGYCGGDNYNFDSDSTCLTMYTDAYNYHYTLYRKKGEKYLTAHKEGFYVESEDPCKNGFDTIFVSQKSLVDQDSLIVFHSEEKRGANTKVLKSISKKTAEMKLSLISKKNGQKK